MVSGGQVVAKVRAVRRAGPVDVSDDDLALLNSPIGHTLRHFLGQQYLCFDTFDQMSFPLYDDTGTGEPSVVEVVRVSPVDATNFVDETRNRRKPAGTALANFGAFLDRRWRANDILWGRLDGVERLLAALLPATDEATATVRRHLVDRAQGGILRETLTRGGERELVGLLLEAILVAALLFGSGDMRTLAVTAFAATLGLYLATLVTGDIVRERRFWLRVVVAGVMVAVLALAAVGLAVVASPSAHGLACAAPAAGAARGVADGRTACGLLSRWHRWRAS